MTLRGLASLPNKIDGWTVQATGNSLEMRKGDRYLKTEGEPWMAADTLMYRALEAASASDIDLAANQTAASAAREQWQQHRQMAEALVTRDRINAAKKG